MTSSLSPEEQRVRVTQAFTPAAPVARRDLFAGRTRQLEALVDTVFQTGQHAIVHGERGVGKTSLACVLTALFADDPTKFVVRVNCDATDDFTNIWKKVIEDLDPMLPFVGRARNALEIVIAKERLVPNDIRRFLRDVVDEREPIILLDEFDTVTHPEVTRLTADTIKTLSDQTVDATLIVVGVADTLDQLLAEHGSIDRSIIGVHMPRMTSDELSDLVRRGLRPVDIDIAAEALDLIAEMSQGFPHFAHVLTQGSARATVEDSRSVISVADVMVGVRNAMRRVEAWISQSYDRATSTGREAIYSQVLLGAALAPKDEKGYFSPADVRDPLSEIIKRRYNLTSFGRHLDSLCESRRGPIFVRTSTSRGKRYRFVEAHMEPYVLMRTFTAERGTGYVAL
jgi:Cdc6-like AAA superfamily ATPase